MFLLLTVFSLGYMIWKVCYPWKFLRQIYLRGVVPFNWGAATWDMVADWFSLFIPPIVYLAWIVWGILTFQWLQFLIFVVLLHCTGGVITYYLQKTKPLKPDLYLIDQDRVEDRKVLLTRIGGAMEVVFSLYVLVNLLWFRFNLWEWLCK